MEFSFTKTIHISFEQAIQKITEALKAEGFGIITEIDMKSTLKNKLDIDFYNYRILGACNPNFAYRALQAEDKIGLMLPCNVVVQEKNIGEVEISAINPTATMRAIDNDDLHAVALEVSSSLKKVIDSM
ncbi:MAG: DUF302 domain-containing protein [Sphingobacteriales bacterium]|nr:DUF302 domain-containing protein [Sphingobacteriales bacterium]